MFKYNLNQIVWYMMYGTIHSAPILSRMYVDNQVTNVCTKEQVEAFRAFGDSGIMYATIHAILSENEIYASKEELLLNL